MFLSHKLFAAGVVALDLALFCTSCSTPPAPPKPDEPPVSRAGADQDVPFGSLATLDGSTSSDPDEEVLSYAWSAAVDNPASVVLTSTSIVRFIPTKPGEYTFILIVTAGATSSLPDSMRLTVQSDDNRSPLGRPGPIMPPLSEATSSSTGPVVRTPTATRSRSYGRRWSIPTSSRSWTQRRCRPRSSPCCLGRTHSNSWTAMGP